MRIESSATARSSARRLARSNPNVPPTNAPPAAATRSPRNRRKSIAYTSTPGTATTSHGPGAGDQSGDRRRRHHHARDAQGGLARPVQEVGNPDESAGESSLT